MTKHLLGAIHGARTGRQGTDSGGRAHTIAGGFRRHDRRQARDLGHGGWSR